MKKIIVLSVLVLLTCQLFSQSQYKYTVGDTIVGKNVKYVCKEREDKPSYLRIDNITNNQGVTQEISFLFAKNAEVLSTLAPDRFYELENKLKKTLKLKIDKESQHVRNPKWNEYISFSVMQ